MYEKNFDLWNEEKKNIEHSGQIKTYKEREIWWTSFGLNIGAEQDGTGKNYDRPAIILKKINNTTCFIVPLTTSPITSIYRVPLGKIKGNNAWAAISQIRVIDVKRLRNRTGKINMEKFETIRKATKEIL